VHCTIFKQALQENVPSTHKCTINVHVVMSEIQVLFVSGDNKVMNQEVFAWWQRHPPVLGSPSNSCHWAQHFLHHLACWDCLASAGARSWFHLPVWKKTQYILSTIFTYQPYILFKQNQLNNSGDRPTRDILALKYKKSHWF